jgi:hypothetical protein
VKSLSAKDLARPAIERRAVEAVVLGYAPRQLRPDGPGDGARQGRLQPDRLLVARARLEEPDAHAEPRRDLPDAVELEEVPMETSFRVSQAQNLSSEDLARRTIERRAVEAVIWGMPAVNTDLMRQELLNKTKGKENEILYWMRSFEDCKEKTTKTEQNPNDSLQRSVLSISDRKPVTLTTYTAKDPETKYPPIVPLRPPAGAPPDYVPKAVEK